MEFEDQTYLTVTISGWGEVRLIETKDIDKHPHVGYHKFDPLSKDFTFKEFNNLIEGIPDNRKCNVKRLFFSEPGLRGIGNGVIQDIFFKSKIHHSREIKQLSREERELLFNVTKKELQEMVNLGGRNSEKDLFDAFGRYERLMHSKSANTPCPNCETRILKKQYGGGSIYFCPECQKSD